MATETRTNEDIKKDVVEQLYWDDRVDASNVQVQVNDGTVVLMGSVPSYLAYDAANDGAWAMSGVREVRNDLKIKYAPGVAVPTDEELRANIENTLIWQPNIDSTEIEISVEDGWVIVKGSVDAFWKKVRVEDLVLSLSGVLGVTNELAIVPTRKIGDKVLAEDIETALERHADIVEDLIYITVENGKVTISGNVPSLDAYKDVERVVHNTPGVVFLDNKLAVQ